MQVKASQMSDEEREIYTSLLNITKSEISRYRCKVVIGSIVVFGAVLGGILWNWISATVAHITGLLIGGQFFTLYGALLLALGAVLRPSTLGLMSMTICGGNPKLFAALMKSRLSAIVGVYFIVGGVLIQSLAMVVFGS